MSKATITVLRAREELERLWREQDPLAGASVSFKDAPGDRGTEIQVEVDDSGLVQKLTGGDSRAKAMDALRRFKARVETGEVARSDAVPEGETAERKFKQRPAQPLEQVGAR